MEGSADRYAMDGDPQALLRAMFDAAVASAQPGNCVPPNLPSPPSGRTVVVGAGKAAAAMAQVVEDNWTGDLSGLVITRYGHEVPCKRIEVRSAAHPLPDRNGVEATLEMLARLDELTADDLVICLLSGGASALLAAPAAPTSLPDLQQLTSALLRSGADIGAINTVRKHLLRAAGGKLALAARPARLFTLAISDVAGDDPSAIGSGPTVGDPTTRADALAVLDRYRISPPAAVRAWLDDPASETPVTSQLPDSEYRLIAGARSALNAASSLARQAGYEPLILGEAVGEAREVAEKQADLVRSLTERGSSPAPPCVLLSGGETTVTVAGDGRGGRNTEFLLALALALGDTPHVHALAADTDGIDGSEDNAGAFIAPGILERARGAGHDPAAFLARNDSYGFFETLGALVTTGPTLTNVNDFRAILIDRPYSGAAA